MGTQAKGFFVALLFSWVGVHHWEYFTLSSIGGFAQFCALMTGVLFSMNELREHHFLSTFPRHCRYLQPNHPLLNTYPSILNTHCTILNTYCTYSGAGYEVAQVVH
jgi:hypothetical protein